MIMIAVRYLESLKRQKYKITDLTERREMLYQKVASARSINYSQVKVQTSHNNDALTSAVVKVSELTERIEQAQAQYFALENEIFRRSVLRTLLGKATLQSASLTAPLGSKGSLLDSAIP